MNVIPLGIQPPQPPSFSQCLTAVLQCHIVRKYHPKTYEFIEILGQIISNLLAAEFNLQKAITFMYYVIMTVRIILIWWNLNHWDTSFWQNAGKTKKLTGRKKPIDDQIGVWNRLQYVTLGMSSNNFSLLSLFWFLLLRLKHGNLICLHVVVIILWYWFVKRPSCVSIVLILSVHFSFLIGALYGIGNALEVKGISKIK